MPADAWDYSVVRRREAKEPPYPVVRSCEVVPDDRRVTFP